MRPTRQGSIPPPGGADEIVEQVRERLPVLKVRPLVHAHLQIGGHAANDVQHEREMSSLA